MPLFPYIYESLSHASEIRLLKLPERPADLRNFALEHVLLTSRPKYHAVSHTWGTQVPYKTLFLNQTSYLKITESLWAAIHLFVQYFAGEYLWIDQICINQGQKMRSGLKST
jgi:Heterokaryon incompatibility protein (HET)